MAYVQVPKDLTKVKSKVMFNLTKRQLICFGLAGAIGVPLYLLTKNTLGTTASACLMIVVVLPCFFFAMYEKDGRPLEKILMNIWRAKFQRPGVRTYNTKNLYALLQEEIYDKEVLGIGSEVKKEKDSAGKTGGKSRDHQRKN
jgi:hypothetical protein